MTPIGEAKGNVERGCFGDIVMDRVKLVVRLWPDDNAIDHD